MKKLLCKPCLAFEALSSLIFCNYCRKDIPEVEEWVKNTYDGITIGPSNRYYDILLNHHSLEEIESFDTDRLVQMYSQYVDEDMIIQGLQRLKESHFEEIWNNTLLPVLEKQCESFLGAYDSEKISDILLDVEKVQGKPIRDDIIVYMTYFTSGVSFIIAPNSYITNEAFGYNAIDISTLFAHELCHRFANSKLTDAYIKLCSSSEYLKRSYYFLSNIVGESGYEEEFVVALECAIAVKRKLKTHEEIMDLLSRRYRNSIPVAIILFSRLEKLDSLPDDMNDWFCTAVNQIADSGRIEAVVNDIIPGYTDKFKSIWDVEKQNRPELVEI